MSLKWTRAVAKAEGLSAKAGNVLRFLADAADDRHGRSFYRQDQIAARLGLSERTVRAALAELETAHWIVRERRFRNNGTRLSDLITLRTLEEAARASARHVHFAQLELPLMRVVDGGQACEEPRRQPAKSAGGATGKICRLEEEPITSFESLTDQFAVRTLGATALALDAEEVGEGGAA